VSDEDQLTALTRRVMQRVDALGPETAAADIAMLAVEETWQTIDEWLASLLDCEHAVSAQELAMARVALLSGTLPQWPAVLLNGDRREFISALRGVMAVPVPEPAELTMEIQQIRLFSSSLFSLCQRCLRLLTAGLGKILKIFGKH
jgi:hypothetical protein